MNPAGDRTLILVGRVVKAHGVRGELKVLPETDDPERLRVLERVFIGDDEATAVSRTIRSVRFQHTRRGVAVLLDLEGVDDRDQAEALRERRVFALRDELPALDAGEFYWYDVIGCSVTTGARAVIGTVKDVLDMPAQPVLVVAREGRPDAWIPAVDAFIEDLDVRARRIVIRPIEGLLDG